MDTGGLKGRKAMLSITTGYYENMVAPDDLLGGLDVDLWHLNSGTLAYLSLPVSTMWQWCVSLITNQRSSSKVEHKFSSQAARATDHHRRAAAPFYI